MKKSIGPWVRLIFALAVLLVSFLLPAAGFCATVGKPAPDFQLADLSGTVHKLSDLRGSAVVLNFWATWCPECLMEIDALSAFAEQYEKKGVAVLSVSVDKNEGSLREFLQGHPVRFPVLTDQKGDVFVRKYFIRGLPATIIIDPQGNIAAVMLGAQNFTAREFTEKIDRLLVPTAKP